MEGEACVYIMASKSGTLYMGSTVDLEGRVLQYKTGEIPGFTKKYGCNRIMYYEMYGTTDEARLRERQIKGYGRRKKEALIRSLNPTWFDLSRFWYDGDRIKNVRKP
jgi:putative endonuclease